MKSPFYSLKDIYKDKLERDRKTSEFIYSQTDSFATWIIGFSFTALTLIVSNIASLKTNLKSSVKPIILFLFITIICGLLFRVVSYLIIMLQKKLDDYFIGAFGDMSLMPTEVDNDIAECDFDTIVKRIKDDFGDEITFPNPLTEEFKMEELPKLKSHYAAWCEYAQKSMNIGLNYIAEVIETAYKIDRNKTIAAFKKGMNDPKIGYNAILWNKVRSTLYLVCLFSFLVTVGIVCIYLLWL